MRVIFSEPVYYDGLAQNLELYIAMQDGLLNDKDLAELLNISEREVREIVERLNYNKYEGINNDYQYRKINGKYATINLQSKHRQSVIDKIKTDMIASIVRYSITSKKLNKTNLMNMTLDQIIKEEL